MADKEERILITTRHKNEKLNMTFTDMYKEYTREQAIEKISHALCTKVHGACEICEAVAGGDENHCNDYRTYAEAALNALLEGHDDER